MIRWPHSGLVDMFLWENLGDRFMRNQSATIEKRRCDNNSENEGIDDRWIAQVSSNHRVDCLAGLL